MKKLILFASLLAIPAWAANQSPQFFVGVKGGYQWAFDDTYQHSKPRGSIWGAYGGLQFTPAWSWDLGYQYHDELKAEVTSVNVETWLIESALRYDWYLQGDLSLYARLGAAYWDMNKTQPLPDRHSSNDFSPLGEVGVNYHLTPSLRLSAGYQYIDSIGTTKSGTYDSHAALVSLSYVFGHDAQPELIAASPTTTVKQKPVAVKEVVTVKSLPQTFTVSSRNALGLFDFDSTVLRSDTIESLTEATSVLTSYPQSQASVVGHTDSIGSAEYNQAISEKRAQAVVDRLLEAGVNPEQLEWHGEGESRPIADNTTAEGRAQNRRVEVTIPSFQFQQ